MAPVRLKDSDSALLHVAVIVPQLEHVTHLQHVTAASVLLIMVPALCA